MENLFEEGVDEKSEFQVRVVRIGKIDKHPMADTLSIISVDGSPVIIKTGTFAEGDLAVYVPVDALVPTARAEFAFLKNSKNSEFHRVRAARLRGIFSMGLLVGLSPIKEQAIEQMPGLYVPVTVGQNVQNLLQIEKWIPPSERQQLTQGVNTEAQKRARKYKGPKLPVYGLDPLRRYAATIPPGIKVVITEKIHGCNSRYVFSDGRLWVGSHKAMRGCSRNRISEWLERLKIKLMSLFSIKHRAHTLAELGDIWWETAEAYRLKEKLSKYPDMVLFGEIYGEGVQDLTYDSPKGRKFRAFDVYDLKTKEYLDYDQFLAFCDNIGLGLDNIVPALYIGEWNEDQKAFWTNFANTAQSTLCLPVKDPTKEAGVSANILEGIVIKPYNEVVDPHCGRVGLKYVGENYLLRDDKRGNIGGKAAKYKKDKAAGFPQGDRVERVVPAIPPVTFADVPAALNRIDFSGDLKALTDSQAAKSADKIAGGIQEQLAAMDAETKAAIAEGRLMRVVAPDGTGG